MHVHNTPTKVIWEIPPESAPSLTPPLVFGSGGRGKDPFIFICASMSPDVSDVD